MRRDLIFAGALLLAGGIAVLVAAFIPALYPVWTARGINAIPLIAQHRGTWQLANWLFVAGAVLTLAGLGALAPLLNRPTHSALPSTALTLMTLASTLWIANLAFRLTITVRTADLTSAGSATPDWYEHVNAWTGGLWYAAALTGGLATIGYGLATTGGAVLPAWTGWTAIGLGVVMLGLFLITRDVPPFLLYLAPTIFGVTALIRAASTSTTFA